MCSRLVRLLILGVATVGAINACADRDRTPTSPSAASVIDASASSVGWPSCGGQVESGGGGWTFAASPDCTAGSRTAQTTAMGMVTVAPTNLRSTVTGSTVRLEWDMAAEDVVSFLVEAGAAPGQTNLATLPTSSAATALTVNGVPQGAYYVRVRAVGSDAAAGPASNEIRVQVGVIGEPPAAGPTQLTRRVVASLVTLTWVGVSTASSYVVEVGSRPNASDVVVFDTGSPATTLTATAPTGLYFVRIRARNAVGTSAASNEVAIGVNVPEPGGTQPTPGPTTPSPPPTSPVQPVAPAAPPVEQVIHTAPAVTVPTGIAEVQLVRGGRPDAGAGPPVSVSIDFPVPMRVRARIAAARPFNRAAVTVDVPPASDRNSRLVIAEAYYDIRLSEPQTSIEITLTIPAGRPFALQVAVSDNNGSSFGSYASAQVGSQPQGGTLTGTWVGTYTYGADCGSYAGVETLNLTESSDGSLSGTLFDATLAGTVVAQANLDGRRSGSDVTFTARYTGNSQGAMSTFRGTFNGTTIEGRINGVCGQGAQVTFSKR